MRCVAAISLLSAGCLQVGIPAFHFAETAEVLRQKEVSITATGMGGVVWPGVGGDGGDLRLRVGVGAHQEVGIEGYGIYFFGGNYGGKLSWKYGPRDWFALIAGLGAGYYTGFTVTAYGTTLSPSFVNAGADLGFVFSNPAPFAKILRVYGGPRLSFGLPLVSDWNSVGGATLSPILALGLSIEPLTWLRILPEVGALGICRVGADDAGCTSAAYAAVSATFIIGRSAPAPPPP